MRLKITPLRYLVRCWAVMATLSLFVGCGSFLAKDEPGYLARVGENYLYREDVAKLLAKGISKEDSASFVTNYINNWASKQLLLEKAKINLPEEKLAAYDVLVSDYRTDLYTRAYKEALVQQGGDTVISASQLNGFYEREKENFKLKEKIVKLRFVELPTQFLNKDDVISKLKRFKKDDISYLDSIGVQFKKLNFNDSIWVSATRIIEEIPPLTFENANKHLKKSQFFELEDANGVYLAKVTDVLDVNDVAPLSFIEPTIKQVLLSRRKLDYLRKLETEIIDEAIKEKEFEVYEQGE
ncbi:peptidyl-prolyl cis-trans isomerase [Zobellia sp. 1_MG-2023]|uniref:peptidyl-prolyl cis-trans isomerase n=1 Tax=Zobellia sp. 1_MG-2023 TaxID=3062626 RepID=UPI0026E46DA1|nr:peptidyl-prolyl cis-trans isomerase [Zobellia sp. 1_MG-2023]MDO6821035.1 peptidyl-prolyl cis-trans isomerase [Zobellia sp. 1_MG-2023]